MSDNNKNIIPEDNNGNELVRRIAEQKYEFGFTTDVHTEIIEKGLNENVVRLISAKKEEPAWMLDFRLKAFHYWETLKQPTWGHVHLPNIDYQGISYYADPTAKKSQNTGSIDPELEKTFDKLGIPLEERLALSGNTAVDASEVSAFCHEVQYSSLAILVAWIPVLNSGILHFCVVHYHNLYDSGM